MIQFSSVKKSYGSEILFDDVTFTIGKGERCGLVGRNGCGKSTIMRMIVGEEIEDEGSIAFPKGYHLGYLEQHAAFTKKSVLEEAAAALPESQKESLYIVEAILFGLGFSKEMTAAAPEMLSGGYHLRLRLAKVLAGDPDCLLLDEPTNYLDIVSIRWLENFLKGWRKEFLLITHDRAFMDSVTTHTMGIQRQKVRKFKGGSEEFFVQILQEEEIYEKSRQKLDKKRAHMESFIKRFGAKATKAAQAQARGKAIERLPTLEKLAQIHDLDFTFNEAPFAGKKILEAQNLAFSYLEGGSLIEGVSLTINKGDIIAIVGKNGRGKSTLLKLLAGELKPKSGTVALSIHAAQGYFGQTHIQRLSSNHTVEEEIALGNPALTTSEARGICGIMMFSGERAKKTISVLSGGEQSRVLLGKIIAAPCNILFLDEPTHHLDMESIEALVWAIKVFDGAVVIVTHSEDILKELPLTHLVVCKSSGQKVVVGDYRDFLESGGWNDHVSAVKKEKKEKPADASKAAKAEARKIENKIIALEGRLKSLEGEILEAVEKKEGVLLGKLSKEREIVEEEIENFFNELEAQEAKQTNR